MDHQNSYRTTLSHITKSVYPSLPLYHTKLYKQHFIHCPCCTNTIGDIIIDVPTSLEYKPKIFEIISLENNLCATSTLASCIAPLNLYSKYFILILLNPNSLDSKMCFQISNLALVPLSEGKYAGWVKFEYVENGST